MSSHRESGTGVTLARVSAAEALPIGEPRQPLNISAIRMEKAGLASSILKREYAVIIDDKRSIML
jgi:hypothetical protein